MPETITITQNQSQIHTMVLRNEKLKTLQSLIQELMQVHKTSQDATFQMYILCHLLEHKEFDQVNIHCEVVRE